MNIHVNRASIVLMSYGMMQSLPNTCVNIAVHIMTLFVNVISMCTGDRHRCVNRAKIHHVLDGSMLL